jgi:hypothetical protein
MTFQEQIKALPEAERVKFFCALMTVVDAGYAAGVPPIELATENGCVRTSRRNAQGAQQMTMTKEQFEALIALLAQIEATGKTNGKPRLGLAGAEEAFFTIQEFVSQLEKELSK